jgi:acyl-CoA synthetase (AMP-forming)/AMP-acid ligase II
VVGFQFVISITQLTLDVYEREYADRHLLHQVVAKWAREKPDATAMVRAGMDSGITWRQFERTTSAIAIELLELGFRKSDFLVTLLPLSASHVLLEYACFQIGVIVAPLDLRLSPSEVVCALECLRPRAFVCQGLAPPFDFRELWRTVTEHCRWIEHPLVLLSDEDIPGTKPFAAVLEKIRRKLVEEESPANAALAEATAAVNENDGALVIFTTGSTGPPKPALLSHRNITCQNMCLGSAFFGGDRGTRTLINLPASHVGGQAELLMTTFFGGGTAVLLDVFEPGGSLRAIQRHKVELLGQIPAMFNFEWRLKDYDLYDLSSLKFAAYGGHAVARAFVDKLAAMAPMIGTGLGLTEAAGFCTYVMAGTDDRGAVLTGVGQDMPVYPCSIRQPMREDGNAGAALPPGEPGHVCFRGPQTFLGYVNDPQATARTISRDGYLYTGDLGYRDHAGLHLTGRAKWVIKTSGYQVCPGDIEAHICTLTDKVASCAVVGVEHAVLSEGVVAVVERKPDADLTPRELDRHARALAPYMRPRHWIILDPGQMPLNRVVKPDYLRVQEMARAAIAELRARGKWDEQAGL